LRITPLENGAVEISDIDILELNARDYEEIKNTLRKETVVLIRNQDTDPLNFAKLVHSVSKGEIRNWKELWWDSEGNELGIPKEYPDPFKWDTSKPYPMHRVGGEKFVDGDYNGMFARGKLDWHSDLNLPIGADGTALQGIKHVKNTRTTFLNTALAYKKMPEQLKKRIEGVYCNYIHDMANWADIISEEQMVSKNLEVAPYAMWLIQENIIGVKGIYFSHLQKAKLVTEDKMLQDDLKDYLHQEKFMYHHDWEVGDIILMDQLLSLHKRRLETDEIFSKRILHRLTFRITGYGSPNKILERNPFQVNLDSIKKRGNMLDRYLAIEGRKHRYADY
jgi:alpha-ketoglutarate-dependent taurine dioxygenase